MTAYVIAQVAIHDQNEYNKYVAEFRPIIQRYGGATVARGLPAEVVEGRVAVFPDGSFEVSRQRSGKALVCRS
jgi:uncharacterized protein (DUF1330 family)